MLGKLCGLFGDRPRGGVDDVDSEDDEDAGVQGAEPNIPGNAAGAGVGHPAVAAAAAPVQGGPQGVPAGADVGGLLPQLDGGHAYAGQAGGLPEAAAMELPDDGAPPAQRPRRAPKAGTGEWFRVHRADPILPDHDVTIVEACHWLATLKSASRMTDDAVDKVCLMVSKFLLPSGNLFPTSYHMVKATLGVENSKACTDHICDNCWSVFPRLPAAEFPAHADDVCQASGLPGCIGGVCGNPRFDRSETGAVTPKRSIYQFDVAETVRDLLEVTLDNWDQVKAQRDVDFGQPATFWGSPAGKQLDAACGYKFSNPPVGEIAVNFALGVILLRCSVAIE